MIPRPRHVRRVVELLSRHPVVAILGPRQVGKTTLAGLVAGEARRAVTRFDLEDARDRARLTDPYLALEGVRGLVVLDEIQRRPEIFEALRVLSDRPRSPARFLLLGSASPGLLRQSSETLAGRIAYHELAGLSPEETGVRQISRLWLRGGFPRAFLARSAASSSEWRQEFVRTFLERDLPQLGIALPAETLRRFWSMIAHWHGQVWNASEFGRAFGVADTTVRRYLDTLASALVVRVLPPWHANLAKRQVKSPKVYVADSGLLHTLLGIESTRDLLGHPKVGASWEGFGLSVVAEAIGALPGEIYFWGTHSGAELDLLVVRGRRRIGFEFKHTSAPSVTPSMKVALADLRLDKLEVIHSGRETFPLAPKIRAVALERAATDLARL